MPPCNPHADPVWAELVRVARVLGSAADMFAVVFPAAPTFVPSLRRSSPRDHAHLAADP